ncbi:hypothetical protein POM88_026262 [Heracleum sosnowskyi]|uniref:Replication factor A C-terminal domain-containing protein n=1 Tax=Heracleum sosnowskyi TaxID=360622 RepID=A0AAD8MPT5_9APIA|nr:hypothetical protein POM88_026262 [Heracleum sosnowskyi]
MIRNQGNSLNNSPTSCSVEGPLPTSNITSNDELSSSSHRGFKKKKENSSSIIGLPASVGRTPLGDITNNNVRRGLRCKMKLKSLPEEDLKSFSRNLFEDNFQRDADHDDHDDEIEESIIDGGVLSDDGLFDSDDSYDIEDDMKFAGHRFIRLRREYVIPEEYASLGSPSVQCKNYGARMWKEERVNKNVESQVMLFVQIKSVVDTQSWFMRTCTTCDHETEFNNDIFICKNCPRTVPHPDTKYKIHVIASDDTGDLEVIMHDREVRTLIGRRARDVLDEVSNISLISVSI